MLSWKLCHVAHLALVDLAAQNCLSGSCKFPFVICAYSLSSPPPHATATAVAPHGESVPFHVWNCIRRAPKGEFFNRAAHNTVVVVGCVGFFLAGGLCGRAGVRPTGLTFFLPFSPILFGCIATGREIKSICLMIAALHRSGLVFEGPHVFCSCWLG